MKKLLSVLSVAIMIAACILPVFAQAASYGTTMYIDNPDTRMSVVLHQEPNAKSAEMAKLKHGTAVRLIQIVDKKWAAVELMKGSDIAYVQRKYLNKDKPTSEPAAWNKYDSISTAEQSSMVQLQEHEQYIAVAKTRPGGKLPVRKGPAKNFSILTNMSSGDEVLVLAEGSQWSRVKNMKTGDIGYTMSNWLIK